MENKTVEEMREYYRHFDILMPIFNPKIIAVDLVDGNSGRIEVGNITIALARLSV